MTTLSIWFWQRMVTPHIAYLAVAMAARGHNVTYVAEQTLDQQRKSLGWQVPELPGVALRFVESAHEARALVAIAQEGTVHLTQGFRSNGMVGFAQSAIRMRGMRHFVIMETVDQRGWAGRLKSAIYFCHLHRWRRGLEGVLAIGADTPDWLRRLAPKRLSIFPFAYFLREPTSPSAPIADRPFRFLFVGSLVPLKRVDLLLQCLGDVSEQEFEVEIVGDGPLRERLTHLADTILPGRVSFRGVVPISEVPRYMVAADCLVLPSDHDGWGAVVSEALMAGTPVVCSAACGSRGVVLASGSGGVFPTFDEAALRQLLADALARGKSSDAAREDLQNWAKCLGTVAGATYLEALLHVGVSGPVPSPPWDID